jgi:hypothetical protein
MARMEGLSIQPSLFDLFYEEFLNQFIIFVLRCDGSHGGAEYPALSVRPLLRGVPQPVHGGQRSFLSCSGMLNTVFPSYINPQIQMSGARSGSLDSSIASVGAPLQINTGLRIENKYGSTFHTICRVSPTDATTTIVSCGATL